MAETANEAILGDLESLTKDPKATEDYSTLAATALAEAKTLVQAGRRDDAINALLAVEKRARQAADAFSVSKLTREVLVICKEDSDWKEVNNYIIILTKKRGQLKRAIIDMVQLCSSWIGDTPDMDTKLELMDTLSRVTQGKIFVEVERARLLRTLAKIKEDEGKIEEAATILEGVQVETFGAMDRREKTEYILEQMRIVLVRDDFIRCQIMGKKINPKLLEAEDFQDLKLRFYEYMIRYYLNEVEYLEVAKSYQSIFNTSVVLADRLLWIPALESFVIYLVLSAFNNEQSDMLHKLNLTEPKKLCELPALKTLVAEFLSPNLMAWPLPYEMELKTHPVFTSTIHKGGDERWSTLRTRVLQHNIKILSTYYVRIRLARISELLLISTDEAEKLISELVTSGFLLAKIDRPAGVVKFGGWKSETDILDDWSRDIAKVLDLVEESCHFVEKERMLHAAKAKRLQAMQRAVAA